MKNRELGKKIIESNEYLSKHEKQENVYNNLTEIASESLTAHLDKVNLSLDEVFSMLGSVPFFL